MTAANERGFTLLEVLVALVILGTAVVAAIQGFAGGLRLLKLAADHQDAMQLADQKLREMTTPTEGREEGSEDRFQWTRTVTKVPTPELEGSAIGRRWGSFEIDVRVKWDDDRREVQLASLRTVPVDASGRPVQSGTQLTVPIQPTTGQTTTPATSTSPSTSTTPGRLSPRVPTR